MPEKVRGNLLIVEDEVSLWNHYRRCLAPLGFQFETAANPKEARLKLKLFQPDLILLDLHFEGNAPDEGLTFLSEMREREPTIAILVVTGGTDRRLALEAVQRGASDFIEKGSGFLDALKFRVQAVFERLQLERQLNALRDQEIERMGGYPCGVGQLIVGVSPAMKRVYDRIDRVAPLEETVLICGESGVGKELFAQALHHHSKRTGDFVPLNCAAIPDDLFESELFGHRRGAFTGASADHAGAFEAAKDGTIFLDEIGETPLALQPRLLRVLQEKKIKRIGENQERPVNVRIVAATNRNLEEEVKDGRFRADLYYRLNTFSIQLPSLRERQEDLPILIGYFANQFCQQYQMTLRRFTGEAIDRLAQHDWPGNLRELRDVIQRSILFTDGLLITPQDLQFSGTPTLDTPLNPTLPTPFPQREADVRPYREVLHAFEASYVRQVLTLTNGNQSRAAELLGIDRNSVRRILERGQQRPRS